MSYLEPDYVNVLKDPFKHPTIEIFPLIKKLDSSNWEKIFGITSSALGYLFGINWNGIYDRVHLNNGDGDNINKEKFNEFFDDGFYNDVEVKEHIYKITKLEIDSGLLSPEEFPQRKEILMEWLYSYYKTQLYTISNVTTSTISNYKFELKLAYLTFSNILNVIFKDGIWLHVSSFKKFHNYLSDPQSRSNVLLLPNHKSHIDYIILHFLFVRFQLETPLVIAGDNLNVPIFGDFLRKMGAIYIKRTFSSDDFYYFQNLINLIKFKQENSTHPLIIELFIEGTRSRNGKLMHGRTGFLNVLKNLDKNFEVMPISLSYEKPLEFDEYLTELNGLDKVQESFGSILSTGMKYMRNDERINFGKLIIRFDDDILHLKDYNDMDKLCDDVLNRIHDIGFVTEISILGMAILIKFYQQDQNNRVDLIKVIPLFKMVLTKVVSKTTYDDHLIKLLNFDDMELVKLFKYLLNKFLSKYISVLRSTSEIIILEETSLVYYKNTLLHFFISEVFLLKANTNLVTLDIITKIFGYEFLTSKINRKSIEINPQIDDLLFHDLLAPFIESYELSFDHLIGVVSISLKHWLYLVYLSRPKVQFKESLNKSNLLYAIHLLKALKLIKTTKQNEIIVLDDSKLRLLRDYLHDLRFGITSVKQDQVFQLFNNGTKL